jgi:MYXO-CTERM domain-containing protein
VVPDGDGGFWALGATTYSAAGTYPVSVVITDSDGGSASVQSTAFVLDDVLEVLGTSLSAVEGAAFAGVVASLTGPSPRSSSYTVSIDWGDGTTSPGRVVKGTAPGFDATGAHTYPRAGTFAVAVTVSAYGEDISLPPDLAVGISNATVADAQLTGQDGGAFQAFEDRPYAGVVVLFADADPYGTWGDYAATIDWGDGDGGVSAADAIVPADGGFAVLGTHTYGRLGAFAVTVAIVDRAGSSTLATSNATVVPSPDAGPPPDAGIPDGGVIWFSDDGGSLSFGDGGAGGTSGGCGCQPQAASPAGPWILFAVVLALVTRTSRRVRRWV